MYVNQIDNIIDQILDKLYLDGITKDETFISIVKGKKINYVEYRDKINEFIQKFMETIDIGAIQNLINNKENLIRILDIIKRYIAYYYFLSLAYYYAGTDKEFRNNLIQYSKLQETSTFTIKNFFDTENNFQVITFFKIIKDVTKIITMTDLQKKTLDPNRMKEALLFIDNLGQEYIDNYLLMITKTDTAELVEINVHNFIKTIVFGEIYRNQEQTVVFEILNEIEEEKHEYMYIDIVVPSEDAIDFEGFREIFMGEDDGEELARRLFDLVTETNKIQAFLTSENKNNNLLKFSILTPIVDDFLRYHRDSEKMENEIDKPFIMPLTSTSNAKNIQLALLYQQRKKKENTRAQLIVNKIDAISDYYSDNVKNNPEVLKDIKKYFQGPLSYRKAVMHNYLAEVKVMNKIINQGRKVMEGNEYYLELVYSVHHAYFNFKDFQKYGVSLNLYLNQPISLLRYDNIEFQNQLGHLELDIRVGVNDSTVNLVGLSIGPLKNEPINCVRKENLVDVRNIKISYSKEGKFYTKSTENGYRAFMKIIKHFYINTIVVDFVPRIRIYNDFTEVIKHNSEISNKVIAWVFDIEKDKYEMETYENLKSYNFQETILYMNATIYDKIVSFLKKKLAILVRENLSLDTFQMEALVERFSSTYQLDLSQSDKMELIIQEYFKNKPIEATKIIPIPEAERLPLPTFSPITKLMTFWIKIDMINPTRPQEYIELEVYAKTQAVGPTKEDKCQHEIEWNHLQKVKVQNLNKYNTLVTQFIEKFILETGQLDFVCKVCGKLLPIKQYVQDGTFDNFTQRFITAYVPLDIPLEEIREYSKYTLTIKYLTILVNRVSLITSTSMFVGQTTQSNQKRKALVKNIIDIILKHNSVNLKKNINDADRLEYFSKKFHVDKDLDSVYFFELDDNIINFTPSSSDTSVTANSLKYNNMLLYFILSFIVELNGAQITMMFHDKIANIYVFNKYGPKLFGDLLIKKNINGMETVPITTFPVLCYLLFLIAYVLIKYKLWYYPSSNTKIFNPVYQKNIINSFIDLINSISIDAGRMPNDYVYMLLTSKFYSQLNNTFKNNSIIRVLKKNHIKYSEKERQQELVRPTEEIITSYPIQNPIQIIMKPRKIPDFQVDSGIQYDRKDDLIYHYIETITDMTNCPVGSYHSWRPENKTDYCKICNENIAELDINIDRMVETYYYELNKIANKRCLDGTKHDFVGKEGQFVCTKCKRKMGETYTRKELDELASNISKIENENIRKNLQRLLEEKQLSRKEKEEQLEIYNELVGNYQKEFGDKMYGQFEILTDKLIKVLEDLIGSDTNLDINKYPVYLNDNVYIIDHSYNGAIFSEPIVLTQKDNRIHFKEEHPFFKTDVYYYTDNRTQIDVFYHAVTLKLLGYKEKHKDYIIVNKADTYLKISPSIKNRFLTIGYESKYVDIGDILVKNSKYIKDTNENYFQILDNLVRDHIYKTKTIIDKFCSIIYRIKFFIPAPESDVRLSYLTTALTIEKLVAKYAKLLPAIHLGKADDAFMEWGHLRNRFIYKPISWEETNIRFTGSDYVNSDLINYYDISGNQMFYYLLTELLSIIDSNEEKMVKTNIAQMYIEIIVYVYGLYNIDKHKNSLELKRFEYILNGSSYMVDILKKGQGLAQSEEIEEQLEDIRPDILDIGDLTREQEEEQEKLEDLKEEAEALDMESDYGDEEEGAPEGEYAE